MSTLPLYWKLSSTSKEERLSASTTLISTLEGFQAQYVPPSDVTSSEEEDEDDGESASKAGGFDILNAEDVRYAIRRLIRGLASPREMSRLGFAVALTELLQRLDTISASQIISLVIESSKAQGSMKGQEVRDMHFARLFGLTSVIESGLLYKTTIPVSSLEDFQTAITELVSLGEKKSWLRETAWWTILLAVQRLRESSVSWKEEAVSWVVDVIFKDPKDWSPEKLALAIKMPKMFPSVDWKKTLMPVFKDGNALAKSTLHTVARVLRDAAVDDEETGIQKKASGTFAPQVHFVWDIIIDQYVGSASESETGIQDVFRVLVDESLFEATSSSERKSWGFQVFERIIPQVSASDVPFLFTKNFMRTWINHLSRDDRYLHKAAKSVAVSIQQRVEQTPQIGLTLILQLLGENGNQQFDKITRTKTVENILSSTNLEGVQEYISFLLRTTEELGSNDSDAEGIAAKRAWVAEQLVMLVKNGGIPKDDGCIQQVLEYFVLYGFCIVKKRNQKSVVTVLHKASKTPFTSATQQLYREKLFSILAHLTSQLNFKDVNPTRSSGLTTDGQLWMAKAVQTLSALEKDTKHVSLLTDLTQEAVGLRTRARLMLDELSTVSESHQAAVKGIQLLLFSFMVQSYEESFDEYEIFQQCVESGERLFETSKPSKSKSKSKSKSQDLSEEQFEPIDVILDTLIGFLEACTPFSKGVATKVFGFMASELKESSIKLLLTQLVLRDPTADDEEMDVDEGDEQDEVTGAEEESEDTVSSRASSGDEDEEVDPLLRKRIAEALAMEDDPETAIPEEQDASSSGSESDEELMDDEQMLALDEKLAEIFRSSQKTGKKERQGAQREATDFVLRVLDLVEIFIKVQSSSSFIVQFVPALVNLAGASGPSEKPLSSKATTFLRSRISGLKTFTSVDVDAAVSALKDIHEIARSAPSPELVVTISQASIYLVRALIHAGSKDAVEKVYSSSMEDYFTRRASKLKVDLLHDLNNRYPQVFWGLRDILLGLCDVKKSVYVFRQIQAFELLQKLLSSRFEAVPSEMETFIPTCCTVITNVIVDAVQHTGSSVNAAQMKDFLKFALFMVRHTRKVSQSADLLASSWDIVKLQEMEKNLHTNEKFKNQGALKSMSNELLNAITIPKTKTTKMSASAKRKATESNDASLPVNLPKKKKKTKPNS